MSRAEITELRARDGVPLRCGLWKAGTPRAALLLVHGVASHLDWYAPLAEELASHGICVAIADRRGTGKSGGVRGDAPNADILLDDVRLAAEHLCTAAPGVPLHLAGVSLGALIATAAVTRGIVRPASLLLITPAFALAQPLTRWQRVRLRALSALWPRCSLRLPYDAKAVARTADWQAALDADGLRLRAITARLARVTMSLQVEVTAHARRAEVPLLLQLAGADRVVDNAAARAFFAAAPGARLAEEYADAPHGLPLSLARGRLEAAMAGWILGGFRHARRHDAHHERDATSLLRRPDHA